MENFFTCRWTRVSCTIAISDKSNPNSNAIQLKRHYNFEIDESNALRLYIYDRTAWWQGPSILLLYSQPSYPCILYLVPLFFRLCRAAREKINVFVLLLLAFDSLYALCTCTRVSVWTSSSSSRTHQFMLRLFVPSLLGCANRQPKQLYTLFASFLLIEICPARFHTHTHIRSPRYWIFWFGASPLVCWNRITAQRNANAYTVDSSRHSAVHVCVCVCVCCVADCGEFRDAVWSCLFFSPHTILCCYSSIRPRARYARHLIIIIDVLVASFVQLSMVRWRLCKCRYRCAKTYRFTCEIVRPNENSVIKKKKTLLRIEWTVFVRVIDNLAQINFQFIASVKSVPTSRKYQSIADIPFSSSWYVHKSSKFNSLILSLRLCNSKRNEKIYVEP